MKGNDMSDRTAHRFRDPRLPLRFWTKAEKQVDGCWLWTAAITSGGYGTFTVDDATERAHRVAYAALAGAIPAGLVLDHLCRERRCVNPAHLEPVTQQTNILRGETRAAEQITRTHCQRGHAYDQANTYLLGRKRRCRSCHNERTKLMKRAAKAAAA